ncbi:MAG: dienelactone hydrolase family protein [Gammaproteobacteria bacterium]
MAIITDIYGCNDFYQSFATFLVGRGWTVMLIDLFSDLGELPEVTREAAFERRHKLRDGEVCGNIQRFLANQNVDAVIGFCLGGNYIFELARRNVDARLVAFYPFPAGLPNQDELTPAFEYLESLEAPVTVLAGAQDDSAGRENMARLAEMAKSVPVLDVRVYEGSGHGFLAQLDSEDEQLKKNAEDALDVCLRAIEE